MLASGVWAGALDRDWAWARTDVDGFRFGDELARIGYRGAGSLRAPPVPRLLRAAHRAGPASGARGMRHRRAARHRLPALVRRARRGRRQPGRPDADGGTGRRAGDRRRHGPRGAGHAGEAGGGIVATVGELHVTPNSRNVVPGGARFTVDIRSWDDDLASAPGSRCGAVRRDRRGPGLRGPHRGDVARAAQRVRAGLVARVRDTARLLGSRRSTEVAWR